jgi:FkbM family methyltransferase
VPRVDVIRRIASTVARSRHQAHVRRNPLDPNGIIAATLGRERLHAMDVGAAGGVAMHWRDYLSVLDVDCFEPDDAECAARQRDSPPNVRWYPVALAGNSGRRPFYVLNRATGSSLYPPNDPVILEYSGRSYAGIRKVTEIECTSLADFLVEHQRPVPELVKLDTQGSELEILSSLSATQAAEMLLVEIEVEFLELYKGQPTFGDVHSFMCGRGFRLLDLRTHRSYRNAMDQPNHYLRAYLRTAAGSAALSAELVAGDALYMRDPMPGEATASTLRELVALVCLLRMYRYYDLAIWTVARAARDRVLSPSESSDLLRDVIHGAPDSSLAQRANLIGSALRRAAWMLGRDDHEVFWTRRKWPDQ